MVCGYTPGGGKGANSDPGLELLPCISGETDPWDLKFPFQVGLWEVPGVLMLGMFRNTATGRQIQMV